MTWPCLLVMLMIRLLNVALICASPYESTFTILFFAAALALCCCPLPPPACAFAILLGNLYLFNNFPPFGERPESILLLHLVSVIDSEIWCIIKAKSSKLFAQSYSLSYFLATFFLPATVLRFP